MLRNYALAGGIVVLALMGTGCAGKEELAHGLTEYEANQIVHVLEQKDVKSKKEKEEGGRTVTYMIIVSGNDAAEARKILVDNQLPRPKLWTGKTFYDPASRPLIPTATQENAEYILSLQGDLSEKLRATIPGIVMADVTIQKPKRDTVRDLTEKPPPATAAVTIVYNLIDDKKPFNDDDIKKLIAFSIEGMEPSNVAVLASLNRPSDKQVFVNQGNAEEGQTVAKGEKVMGILVADAQQGKKLTGIVAGLGILAGVLFLAFIGVFVGFMKVRTEAATAKANLTKLQKRPAPAAEPPPAG